MPAEDHCYNAPERDVYLLVVEYKQAMNDPAVIQLKETNKTLLMFNKTQLMITMNFKSYGNLKNKKLLRTKNYVKLDSMFFSTHVFMFPNTNFCSIGLL